MAAALGRCIIPAELRDGRIVRREEEITASCWFVSSANVTEPPHFSLSLSSHSASPLTSAQWETASPLFPSLARFNLRQFASTFKRKGNKPSQVLAVVSSRVRFQSQRWISKGRKGKKNKIRGPAWRLTDQRRVERNLSITQQVLTWPPLERTTCPDFTLVGPEHSCRETSGGVGGSGGGCESEVQHKGGWRDETFNCKQYRGFAHNAVLTSSLWPLCQTGKP